MSDTTKFVTTQYTAPKSLLDFAELEVSRATEREQGAARRAYEAYNAAVGGRSAVTGAVLPTWEQNTNALVKHGWLVASQVAERPMAAEVDELSQQLAAARGGLKARAEQALTDSRMKNHFDGHLLKHLSKLEDPLAGVLEALLKNLSASAWLSAELKELQVSVRVVLNSMAEEGALQLGHQRLLEAAAMRLQSAGYTTSAEVLRVGAKGGKVVEARTAKPEESAQQETLAKQLEAVLEEKAALRLALGASFNAIDATGPLTAVQKSLLEGSVKLLKDMGHQDMADFLGECMRGEASVDLDELKRIGAEVVSPPTTKSYAEMSRQEKLDFFRSRVELHQQREGTNRDGLRNALVLTVRHFVHPSDYPLGLLFMRIAAEAVGDMLEPSGVWTPCHGEVWLDGVLAAQPEVP